jgi:hypothetical protein
MKVDQIEKKLNSQFNWKILIFNLLGLIAIFVFLLLLRAPLLVNADYFLSFDEAYQGGQIIDLLKGGPVQFYYEGESYAGIFLGLAAAPFFWLFGISAFAYKVPATIAYALYIMSSYWIAKKINPSTALTVVFLMIFPPIATLVISVNNWPHNLIVFLGNAMILLFFKYKESENPGVGIVFLLGATIGFSIYSYTYSILYIASLVILFVLTHQHWDSVRSKISIKVLLVWWQGKKTVRLKIVGILDAVIVLFVAAILFSYVFGGFGIDIAGYSILQINNLHKPVGQVLIILVIRMLIYRDDICQQLKKTEVSVFLASIAPLRLMVFGALGFLLGIFPRIASILIGETTRGGQGFDVDFNPVKIFAHLWELITSFIPNFFDVREPIVALVTSEWSSIVLAKGVLAIVMVFLLVKSVFYFYADRSAEIGNIVQLKGQKFNPGLVYIVFPILIFSAVVMIQNGVVMRYLLPLHGVVAIWVALYLDKIRLKSKLFFIGLLFVWAGSSLINVYGLYSNLFKSNYYSSTNIVRDFAIHKYPNPYRSLVRHCEDKKITHIYSDMQLAAQINFFGKGNIIAGVYDQDKRIRRKNQVLSSMKSFSIVISITNEHHLKTYKAFLDKLSLKFSEELVDGKFWVLTDFVGAPADIDKLRHLIPLKF